MRGAAARGTAAGARGAAAGPGSEWGGAAARGAAAGARGVAAGPGSEGRVRREREGLRLERGARCRERGELRREREGLAGCEVGCGGSEGSCGWCERSCGWSRRGCGWSERDCGGSEQGCGGSEGGCGGFEGANGGSDSEGGYGGCEGWGGAECEGSCGGSEGGVRRQREELRGKRGGVRRVRGELRREQGAPYMPAPSSLLRPFPPPPSGLRWYLVDAAQLPPPSPPPFPPTPTPLPRSVTQPWPSPRSPWEDAVAAVEAAATLCLPRRVGCDRRDARRRRQASRGRGAQHERAQPPAGPCTRALRFYPYKMFFPELNEPARPTAARPVSRGTGGRAAGGSVVWRERLGPAKNNSVNDRSCQRQRQALASRFTGNALKSAESEVEIPNSSGGHCRGGAVRAAGDKPLFGPARGSKRIAPHQAVGPSCKNGKE